jgi:primosomal protein N'
LIKLSFSHRAQSTAETQAKALTRRLAAHMRNLSRTNARARVLARVSVLGPAPAFAPRVGGRYAWYALLKWPRDAHGAVENLALRNRLLDAVPQTWDIDVDPIDVV